MERRVVTDYTNVRTDNTNVKVFIRARPPEVAENEANGSHYQIFNDNPKKIIIRDPSATTRNYGEHAFMFDRVFWANSTQDEVFNVVCRSQVDHCLNGFNSCCFAYGQTGSGKTYSMFGLQHELRGMIPRSVEYLFARLNRDFESKEINLAVSFSEIYCDRIRDLGKAYITPNNNSFSRMVSEKTSDIFARQQMIRNESFGRGLKNSINNAQIEDDYEEMNYEIHEDAEGNVFVKDLASITVSSVTEVMNIIQMGLKLRATHETKMNSVSSRSHTVFTISVTQTDRKTLQMITGKLNLVDLAGSERLKKSESEGIRLQEAVHINSSLTALGKVIMALDPTVNAPHVPYRDSKLTRLLQNSLGGNSYTTLLATIHPTSSFADECLSTLQFANRCRNVQNQPRVNYVGISEADKDNRIKRLLDEISNLQRKISQLEILYRQPNKQILMVLNELGISANILPDGSIQLQNGRIVGNFLSNQDNDNINNANNNVNNNNNKNDLLLTNSLNINDVNYKVTEQIRILKDNFEKERKILKSKSKQLKDETSLLQNELKDKCDYIIHLQSEHKKKENELLHEIELKQLKIDEITNTMKDSFDNQIKEIVGHNQQILQEQYSLWKSLPEHLKSNCKIVNDMKTLENRIRIEQQNKYLAQLKAFEFGKTAEIEQLKQQYEFWLQKKNNEIESFVENFNLYREKQQKDSKDMEHNLVEIFEYSIYLYDIIKKILHNEFPVKQNEFSIVPIIPTNYLYHPTESNRFNYIKQIYSKYISQNKIKKKDNLSKFWEEMNEKANSLKNQSNNSLFQGTAVTALRSLRPQTAPKRPNSNSSSLSHNNVFNNNNSNNNKLLNNNFVNQAPTQLSENELKSNIEDMDNEQLKNIIHSFRYYFQNEWEKSVQKQVLVELNSNETVEYLKNLENEKLSLNNMLKEQKRKYNELRVAFNSVSRTFEKTNNNNSNKINIPQK